MIQTKYYNSIYLSVCIKGVDELEIRDSTLNMKFGYNSVVISGSLRNILMYCQKCLNDKDMLNIIVVVINALERSLLFKYDEVIATIVGNQPSDSVSV